MKRKGKKLKCKRKKTCNVEEDLAELHSEKQAPEMETSLSVKIENEYVVKRSKRLHKPKKIFDIKKFHIFILKKNQSM